MISLPRCNEPWKASPKIHRKRQHKARIRLVRETLHILIGAASQSLLLMLGTRSRCQTSINRIHTGSANLLENVGVLVWKCLKYLLGSFYTMTMRQLWRTLPTSRVFKCESKNIYQRWWMMMICESNYHSWPSLMQFQSIIVHHPFPLTISNQYQRSYKTESNIIKHRRIWKESMSLQFTSWIR